MSALFYTHESRLQKDIIEFLERRGIFHYRQNSGAVKRGNRYIRFTSLSGLPDVICIVDGIYLGLEIKKPKGGKVSPVQKETHALIKAAGGECHIVKSVDEVREIIETLKEQTHESNQPRTPNRGDQTYFE